MFMYYDRLGFRKNRKNNTRNISLDLESKDQKELQAKEEINEIYFNNGNLFCNKW
tara:strand:- start:401 stop:565 length:165 start_codon:yes stop_codon:yes gene_type:complete